MMTGSLLGTFENGTNNACSGVVERGVGCQIGEKRRMKKKISGSDGIDVALCLFLIHVPYIYCYVSTRLCTVSIQMRGFVSNM